MMFISLLTSARKFLMMSNMLLISAEADQLFIIRC